MAEEEKKVLAEEEAQEEAPPPKGLKKLFSEFKEFAMRGNVIELAVGVVIASAFTKITNSLVNDIIMPIIGALIKNETFNNLFIPLNGQSYPSLEAARAADAPVIALGSFITVVADFLIMAVALFIIIKIFNKIGRTTKKATQKIIPMVSNLASPHKQEDTDEDA